MRLNGTYASVASGAVRCSAAVPMRSEPVDPSAASPASSSRTCARIKPPRRQGRGAFRTRRHVNRRTADGAWAAGGERAWAVSSAPVVTVPLYTCGCSSIVPYVHSGSVATILSQPHSRCFGASPRAWSSRRRTARRCASHAPCSRASVLLCHAAWRPREVLPRVRTASSLSAWRMHQRGSVCTPAVIACQPVRRMPMHGMKEQPCGSPSGFERCSVADGG